MKKKRLFSLYTPGGALSMGLRRTSAVTDGIDRPAQAGRTSPWQAAGQTARGQTSPEPMSREPENVIDPLAPRVPDRLLILPTSPKDDAAREEAKDEESAAGEKKEELPHPLTAPQGNIRCITIIGQIEGHYLLTDNQKTTKYEHVLPALVAVEEDPAADGLLILLNTVGGDVEAGLAIAELIASMRKPTVSLVLGGGHSIGVPLAVSARRSFIVPSATMTVHPVRINGTVIGAPQTYFWLEQVQKRIVDFVAAHSHISAERFSSLMMVPDKIATDIGTILDGRQAVEEGLIDRVGGLSDAVSALKAMIAGEEKGTGG